MVLKTFSWYKETKQPDILLSTFITIQLSVSCFSFVQQPFLSLEWLLSPSPSIIQLLIDLDHLPSSATCRFYKVYDSFVLTGLISQMLDNKNTNISHYQGPEDRTLCNILSIQTQVLKTFSWYKETKQPDILLSTFITIQLSVGCFSFVQQLFLSFEWLLSPSPSVIQL